MSNYNPTTILAIVQIINESFKTIECYQNCRQTRQWLADEIYRCFCLCRMQYIKFGILSQDELRSVVSPEELDKYKLKPDVVYVVFEDPELQLAIDSYFEN